MSEWMRIVAYVLITLFLGLLLKELGFRGATLVLLFGTVSVVGVAVLSLGKIFSLLPGVDAEGREYAEAMLKIIGVGYVFGICSDVCSQLGEGSLSSAVALCGRVEIIALSVPFIKRIIEKGIELL